MQEAKPGVWRVAVCVPLLIGIAGHARAQIQSELAACAAIEAEQERLACFDRLTRGEQSGPAREPAGREAGPGAESPAAAAPSAARPPSALPEPAAPQSARARSESRPETEAPERAEAAPRAAPAAPARAAAAVSPEPSGRTAAPDELPPEIETEPETIVVEDVPASIGNGDERDGLFSRSGNAAAPRSVMIVGYQENLSGLAILTTEAGDVLEQVSPRRGRFPDPPFAVSLEPASLGTYFVDPGTGGRPIRVRMRE